MAAPSFTPLFQIGQSYSFDLYPVAVLGAGFTNASVVAIMDSTMANREIDIQSEHIAVFPSLPSGTPNDPTQYNYVKFMTTAGQPITLGIPWINASTVVLTESNTIIATIANVSQADMSRITNALIANGYNAFSLSIN